MVGIIYTFALKLFSSALIFTSILFFPAHAQAHASASEEIIEINQKILQQPNNVELYLRRGNLHRINGHWQQSIEDYKQAKRLLPNDTNSGEADPVNADLGLGRTYLDQGDTKQAINTLNRVITLKPSNVRALISRAEAFRHADKPLLAAKDYGRAIRSFNSHKKALPDYYFERAKALEAAGDSTIASAIKTLDAGIKDLGELRIFVTYAIDLEQKRHNYNAALRRLNTLINHSARKEAQLTKRGEILIAANRPVDAKKSFIAARDAINRLQPQRRYSRTMKTLLSDIESNINALDHTSNAE